MQLNQDMFTHVFPLLDLCDAITLSSTNRALRRMSVLFLLRETVNLRHTSDIFSFSAFMEVDKEVRFCMLKHLKLEIILNLDLPPLAFLFRNATSLQSIELSCELTPDHPPRSLFTLPLKLLNHQSLKKLVISCSQVPLYQKVISAIPAPLTEIHIIHREYRNRDQPLHPVPLLAPHRDTVEVIHFEGHAFNPPPVLPSRPVQLQYPSVWRLVFEWYTPCEWGVESLIYLFPNLRELECISNIIEDNQAALLRCRTRNLASQIAQRWETLDILAGSAEVLCALALQTSVKDLTMLKPFHSKFHEVPMALSTLSIKNLYFYVQTSLDKAYGNQTDNIREALKQTSHCLVFLSLEFSFWPDLDMGVVHDGVLSVLPACERLTTVSVSLYQPEVSDSGAGNIRFQSQDCTPGKMSPEMIAQLCIDAQPAIRKISFTMSKTRNWQLKFRRNSYYWCWEVDGEGDESRKLRAVPYDGYIPTEEAPPKW